jgi:glycosyltransferase involved in cell wall biosynthesis
LSRNIADDLLIATDQKNYRMRLCIVQALLPLYSISFLNRIVDLYPDIDLVVLADLENKDSLNQYRDVDCRFRVVHAPYAEYGGFVRRKGLISILDAQQADVVIFSGSTRDLSQLLAIFVYRLRGKRFGVWGMFHRIGGPRLVSEIYYKLTGALATKCLTYTRTGAVNLVSLGVPKRKVVVIGTAIDERIPFAEARKRTAQDIAAFKGMQGLTGKYVVLQVVRLSRIKRPELLIHAAAVMRRTRADVVFALIGDGEMRVELEVMVHASGLQDCFRFLGAMYDESALAQWYLSADVFVVPTFLGLSAHHAMSYGLPVVTDNSLDSQGSEFDIVAEGLNALTYQEGSAEDLARVLNQLGSDPALRKVLAINARNTIENVHNLERKTRNFVEQAQALAG